MLLIGDLYAIMGLEDKTYEAGDADIKAAYRKLAIMYHPDKLGEKITEQDKEIWLKVQNAYETLIDPAKRKKYDSALPFDDIIPSESDNFNDDNFYEIFAAVFNRNARFAKKKPVPNLGDPATPMDQVNKFYKYWDYFETWREFSQYYEYDPREAADRYEKRYMEKENKRVGDKYMKKERARLIKLVDLAYKNDPRIKKQKMEEELEKKRKKQEIRDKKDQERRLIEEKVR
jgi:DnaJ family protein C protein 2